MSKKKKRFSVALSFPGEHRNFVCLVAQELANSLGQSKVLYDKYHESEFARLDLDTHLQQLYHDESELVVVFLCADYERKEWPRMEWRAIRDLIMQKRGDTIMLVRVDEGDVSGVFSIDGYVDASGRSAAEVASLILARLADIQRTHIPGVPLNVDLSCIRPFTGSVERKALFSALDEVARRRDIVFAVGGVGSGLTTFLDQFERYLGEREDRQLAFADFDSDIYDKIHVARTKQREAVQPLEFVDRLDYDHFDLKCLLAALAYRTYDSLYQRFSRKLNGVLPDDLDSPVRFAGYYFNSSGAMFRADIGPIVEHFFDTVQILAKATGTERVVVFMPWSQLAACFVGQSGTIQERLARELWEALGTFSTHNGYRAMDDKSEPPPELSEKYDKVCLIVATSKVPYAHVNAKEQLVRKSVWPMPWLSSDEMKELLTGLAPTLLKVSMEDDSALEIIYEWSGGSPWYVSLIFSCIQHLIERGVSEEPPLEFLQLVQAACITAEKVLTSPLDDLDSGIAGRVQRHLDAVLKALGGGQNTDSVIEDAWAGPKQKWRRGIKPGTPRVEDFVASGLVWLSGDPCASSLPQDVFGRHPTLFLRRAGRLPLAVYRRVSARPLELAEF